MKNKLLSIIFFNRANTGILLFLLISLLSVKTWGQTTFFEFTGSSGYSATPAAGWTSSGTEGGAYLKLSPGSVTSPLYAASSNVTFTYTIASFGSGGNTNTKLTILNSSNAVISEFTLTATNSSSYSAVQTVNVGNIASSFKVKIEGLGTGANTNANRGTRLRDYKLVGTVAPVTYTLTYNGNGNSSGTPPTAGSHASGTNNVTLPSTTMTRTGYTFAGWHTNATGNGTNYNAGATYSMPASNTTLYARWAYAINYNNNGGSGSSSQTGYNNNSVTLNSGASFSRVGYTFGGWKTTSGDGGTANYAGGATYSHSGSSSTMILYAHWISNGAVLVATPSTLSSFNYIEGSGPSAVQTFTLTGVTLDGSNVELLAGEGYEISIDNGLTWFDYDAPTPATISSYTGSSLTVSVRLKAGNTAGTYNDILLIEGGGDTDGATVTLNGTVSPCVAPATQSVLNAFTSVGTTDMTANFTASSGDGRIVIMNTINSFTNPTNSTTLPTANSNYAGSGEQVVYAGSGNTVTITGLTPSTTYWFRVYNYNNCSGTYTYNSTAPTNNPRSQATLCDVPVTPNGELTPAENPACGSTTLVYEHGSSQPQAGVSYYWQSNASGSSTANPVSSPLTINATGNYYVRAYNGNCWSEALAIPMVVHIPVNITSNLSTTPRTTCNGGTAFTALSVSATGTGLSYQWYSNTSPSTDTATSTAVGTNSNSFTPPSNVEGTLYYYVVVSGTAPCTAVTSNILEHTVHPVPNTPDASQITGDRTGCGNVMLTKSDSNWYWQTSATGTATDPLNSDTTYTASASGTLYVRAYNGNCWSTALAIPIVVTIPVNITSNLSTTPRNTCYGGSAFTALSVSATGTGLSYQWYSNTSASTDTATSTAVGTNSNSFTPPSNAVGTLYYYVVVSGTAPCTAVTSNTLEHTVNPVGLITSIAPASGGPVGTVVTITGTGFTPGSTVKFGSVAATDVQIISLTEIQAVVPEGAVSNAIEVSTALSCPAASTFTIINQDASGCN